jgi:exopolysaccharide biosynthesis polyprenyl glycosylphosphotransferase
VIRRHATALRALLMLCDGIAALVVLTIVAQLRPDWRAALTELVTPAGALLYGAGWVAVLYMGGEYRLRARWTMRSEASGIVRAGIWMGLLTTSALFLAHAGDVSRLFVLLLFPVQIAVTIGIRAALRWGLAWMRRHGRNTRNVLVLGTGPRALAFASQLEEHSTLGLRVIGFLGEGLSSSSGRWPYLGRLSDLEHVLHGNVVDEVAVCLTKADWATVESITHLCQDEGKIVRVPLDLPQFGSGRRFVEDFEGNAVLSLVKGPDHVLTLMAKRVFDLAGAAVALVILAPLLVGVGVYIRLREGSPVLFRQTRIGVHGRPFTIYKFRTMVADAEARYADVVALSDTQGAAFKMKDDPRVTATGRFLRKTSIDELPQLFNVLKGEMSLVGPRPAPPREVDGYDLWHRRRLSMKPGITGLWQISSRIDEDFDDRARLDLDYIDRWSLWLDLKIVVRTVPAVLSLGGQ